jgi:TPR repeat protein
LRPCLRALLALLIVAAPGCASKKGPDPLLVPEEPPSELVERGRAGRMDAQMELARGYEFGASWQRDGREAARWYRRAAEQGNHDAEAALGRLYYLGRGVPRDATLALVWYEKAAAAGQSDALVGMGLLEHDGDLAEPNYVEAAKWMTLAAERGNAFAEKFIRETLEQELSEGEWAEARRRAELWRPTR